VSSRLRGLALAPELAARIVPIERLEQARGRRKTGLTALDELLAGGWPRAALSEISGRRSSGRTAVVLRTLAETIASGEATALVDAGGTFDARAAGACGVTLPQLLWIRCAPTQALRAADLVVAAGGFGVVALDLCDLDGPLRAPSAAWMRLKHVAAAQGTSVLVATATRTLGTFAAAAVELQAGAPVFLTDGPALFADISARAARLRGAGPQLEHQLPTCASLAFSCRS
jgi:RecA/RadA recombinase